MVLLSHSCHWTADDTGPMNVACLVNHAKRETMANRRLVVTVKKLHGLIRLGQRERNNT